MRILAIVARTLRATSLVRTTLRAILSAALACGVATASVRPTERPWTVGDSIAVRYIVGDFQSPGVIEATTAGDPIAWAPDGRHFFFVARHGELSCDCTVYEMYVFASGQIERSLSTRGGPSRSPPLPLQKVTFSSSRSDALFQGIGEPRWESNDSILFFGVRNAEPRHVYRLDIRTGTTTRLSSGPHDVIAYAARGSSIVYGTRENKPGTVLDEYPIHAVSDDDLLQLGGAPVASFELLAAADGAVASLGAFTPPLVGSWVSSSGSRAIVATQPDSMPIPRSWSAYEVKPRAKLTSGSRFMSIDMPGRIRPILDAPLGTATRAGWNSAPDVLWFADGERAVLVNTALPLDDALPERRITPYIVEVEPQTGRWSIVDELTDVSNPNIGKSIAQIVRVEWLRQDQQILVQRQLAAVGVHDARDPEVYPVETSVYVRDAHGWTRVPNHPQPALVSRDRPVTRPKFKVAIKQSANDPPVPMTVDGKRELPLLGSDPALIGIRRSRVSPVHWRERDGRMVAGGLMLPADYGSSRRVPLVIQASAYSPHLFLPDGTATTAFAAQALASAGMAVLFIDIPLHDPNDEWRRSVVRSVREGIAFVERIDAAVESVASQYSIDPARTGLIGFSRSGFLSYYAITHPGKARLAAAVIADAWSASYGEYVVDAATSAANNMANTEFESYYGGGTFWKNKNAWLEHSPVFNVDRVVTPVLFTIGNKPNNLLYLETVGAFRLNRRPFEYLTFRDGAHQLQRPRERQASLEASVDWMAFWLQGREDPNPGKVALYERWKAIKARWEKVQREEVDAARASPASSSR
jgi:hypothetical protein